MARFLFQRRLASVCSAAALMTFSACGSSSLTAPGGAPTPTPTAAPASLSVTAAAFSDGGNIPSKYTCRGADVSPEIEWGEPPAGTAGFALLVEDPDGQNYTHWVVYDLPLATRKLPEEVPPAGTVDGGGRQGLNDSNSLGYFGPCPPSGVHHYHFEVYALSSALGLGAGARKADVQGAMSGKVLARGEIVGLF